MLVTSRIVGLALAVGLVVSVGPVGAQDKSDEQQNAQQQAAARRSREPSTRRVVKVEHQNVKRLADLARSFAHTRYDDSLRVIVLTGAESAVDDAEKMIQDLDQPSVRQQPEKRENVELTVYLIGATAQDGQDFSNSPVAPVIDQLGARFSHSGYRLLDSLEVRVGGGRALHVQGALPDSIEEHESRVRYDLRTAVAQLRHDEASVQIDLFALKMYRQSGSIQDLAELETRLTVPTDKLVVVGKAGVDDPLMEGLFVVLSARVVE